MADFLILAVLALETILLSRWDRRRFGTWVTPFNVLAYPYTAVVFLAYFLAPSLDFVPLYVSSLLVWIVGLLLIWAVGSFVGWGVFDLPPAPEPEAADRPSRTDHREQDFGARRLAILLAWAILPLLAYGVLTSARAAGGFLQIGSLEFKVAYAQGVPGHALVLATLLVVTLIGTYHRPQKLSLATIAMLLVFLSLNQVKGTILQAIIGGAFFRMLRGQLRITWKKIAILLGSTYAIFNLTYLIGMLLTFSDEAFDGSLYAYLGRHYFFYLFAGPLALGEAIHSGAQVGESWFVLFAPFINVYRAILGAGGMVLSGSTHEKGMATDLLPSPEYSNVYTFFGTPYLYLGIAGAILYIAVIALLCYGFLILVRTRKDAWLTAAYCFIAAELSLGFFELYFWSSTPYETIAWGALLSYVLRASHKQFRGPIQAGPRPLLT